MENTLEVQELSLEKVIDSKLVQNNITDQVLNALKKKYSGLKLASIDDKEGYLVIKDARKEVRKVGLLTEKLCKQGREEAIAVQKKWLAKEKEILGKISLVQDPLDAEIERFDNEVARKEQEEINRKEQAYMQRQTTLLKMEAKYDNNSFVLGNVSYEIGNIRDAEDEVWEETILPKYQREFAKIDAERVEMERQKKEAEDKLKEGQLELQRQQDELNRQREEMRVQQEQLQQQKDEANRKENERLAEEKRIKAEADNRRWRDRIAMLDEIGWNGQFAFPRLGDNETKVFTYDELVELSDDTFNARKDEYNSSTAKIKKEISDKAEEKRLSDIEQAKQDAIKQEQERIAEQNRLAEIKRQQEEQQRQEEAAKASDKDKWALYVQQIGALQRPLFTSSIYKGKAKIAKEKIEEIQSL